MAKLGLPPTRQTGGRLQAWPDWAWQSVDRGPMGIGTRRSTRSSPVPSDTPAIQESRRSDPSSERNGCSTWNTPGKTARRPARGALVVGLRRSTRNTLVTSVTPAQGRLWAGAVPRGTAHTANRLGPPDMKCASRPAHSGSGVPRGTAGPARVGERPRFAVVCCRFRVGPRGQATVPVIAMRADRRKASGRVPRGTHTPQRKPRATNARCGAENTRLDRDLAARKYVPVADGPPRDGADRAAVT
jgi:hypothetical protein